MKQIIRKKKKFKDKLRILFSVSLWPWKYIQWRLLTAYPNGWKYAIKHPIIFIRDISKYLEWCQMMDEHTHD